MADRADVMRLKMLLEDKQFIAGLRRAGNAVKGTDEKIKRSTGRMATSFGDVTASVNRVRNVLYAGGALALAREGVRTLDELAGRAERISSLSRGFESLSRSIGESSTAILNSMRPAAQGLVTDLDLMQQANAAIILGLPVTAESMGQLTEASVKLGRAMGINANKAIESVITGIGRQSRMWLDNIGIVVDVEAAYQKFADTLGVQKSELTETQKKMAFYEETVRKATTAAAALSAESENLSDIWNRQKVSLENLKNAYLGLINTGTIPFLKQVNAEFEKLNAFADAVFLSGAHPQDMAAGLLAAGVSGAAIPDFAKQMIEMALSGRPPHEIAGLLLAAAPRGEPARPSTVAPEFGMADLGGLPPPGLLTPPPTDTAGPPMAPGGDLQPLIDSLGKLETLQESQPQLVIHEMARSTEDLAAQARALSDVGMPAAFDMIGASAESAKWKTEQMLSAASAGTAALASIFPKQKGFAYANAIINTAEAVTMALKSAPPPANFALAAVVAAAGLAQIKTISNARPGTSGGITLPGGGGGTLGGSQFGGGLAGGGGGGVNVTVFLDGAGFIQDPDALIRDLGTGLQQELDRAGVSVTSA